MICPNCGGKTKVQETRGDGGTVFRVRKCRSCKFRFRTREEIGEDIIIQRIVRKKA